MSLPLRVVLILLIGHLFAPIAWADFLPTTHNLTRELAHGSLALTYSYKKSDEFFAAQGSLQNSAAQFNDHRLLLHADYGLTEKLTLTADIPLIYRIEERVFNADDFGFGDSTLGMIYQLWQTQSKTSELALIGQVKFPSGDSDVQLLNVAGSSDRELPLGTGQFDLIAGFQSMTKLWQSLWRFEFLYLHRLGDRVNYLQAIKQGIDPGSGDPFTQTVGNIEVNYGQEFRYLLASEWPLLNQLRLGAHIALRHFLQGEVEQFTINDTSSVKTTAKLPAGYEFSVTPHISWQASDRTHLEISARIPIAGEDTPVLSITESLVGITYQLQVSYGF